MVFRSGVVESRRQLRAGSCVVPAMFQADNGPGKKRCSGPSPGIEKYGMARRSTIGSGNAYHPTCRGYQEVVRGTSPCGLY